MFKITQKSGWHFQKSSKLRVETLYQEKMSLTLYLISSISCLLQGRNLLYNVDQNIQRGLFAGRSFAKSYMNLTTSTMTKLLLKSHLCVLNYCIGSALVNLVSFVTVSSSSSHLYPFSIFAYQKALSLVHIRGPAKFAVARFFAHRPWITKTQLDEVLATDPYFAHSKDLDAEDIFVTEDNASVGSAKSSMEEDDPPYYEFSMSGVPLRMSLFNATGLPKQSIYPLINIAQNSSLLFITETWLLSPNKYSLPSWKQFYTYDVPVNSYNLHRGQPGLALLVNPDFKLPIHHINHVNPLLAKFTLSIIINSKLLIHCLYLPPSLESAQVSEILSLLPLDYPTTNKTIICGDFNSRIGELVGDSRWNTSGRIFRNWMEAHNLILWNQYLAFGQPTSYTYHGTSIIDYFLSNTELDNPDLVIEDELSLNSNHTFMTLSFNLPPAYTSHNLSTEIHRPHWNLKKLKKLDCSGRYESAFKNDTTSLVA
ncbi:hypothetical protein G6F29_011108 [Rhizopus arrhizus]|nr:hypothetical protein G6F30_011529 [Rhizopus arrhizus]KAG0976020.1 hypothetical protein G6F29_011108 [Rhizopus arrhizus]KAG0984078.1 hypothetical protein G6F28_010823 [Rhizopus arrhizus]KAG1003357.1 hypothetical protein G6F27_011125 [Rhizopus arrhizus]KAG1017698.1 hypothetical protein G6F26_011532 [Rhizopus arrhizus]